jgi:hypothetical protein
MRKTLWSGLKRLSEAWKALARKLGNFQVRVLLTIIYGILLLPFGLCVRLLGDPLRIKKPPTRWVDRAEEPFDIEWARRQ